MRCEVLAGAAHLSAARGFKAIVLPQADAEIVTMPIVPKSARIAAFMRG